MELINEVRRIKNLMNLSENLLVETNLFTKATTLLRSYLDDLSRDFTTSRPVKNTQGRVTGRTVRDIEIGVSEFNKLINVITDPARYYNILTPGEKKLLAKLLKKADKELSDKIQKDFYDVLVKDLKDNGTPINDFLRVLEKDGVKKTLDTVGYDEFEKEMLFDVLQKAIKKLPMDWSNWYIVKRFIDHQFVPENIGTIVRIMKDNWKLPNKIGVKYLFKSADEIVKEQQELLNTAVKLLNKAENPMYEFKKIRDLIGSQMSNRETANSLKILVSKIKEDGEILKNTPKEFIDWLGDEKVNKALFDAMKRNGTYKEAITDYANELISLSGYNSGGFKNLCSKWMNMILHNSPYSFEKTASKMFESGASGYVKSRVLAGYAFNFTVKPLLIWAADLIKWCLWSIQGYIDIELIPINIEALKDKYQVDVNEEIKITFDSIYSKNITKWDLIPFHSWLAVVINSVSDYLDFLLSRKLPGNEPRVELDNITQPETGSQSTTPSNSNQTITGSEYAR